jgi:hypothetical protein
MSARMSAKMSAKYSDLPLGAARFGQVIFLFRAFESTCDF